MNTPSTPEVKQPASATDPRFSTSGILNAQLKEKNRQGLLSTYGGRDGKILDVNKFTENKIEMRDTRAVSAIEQLANLYRNVANNNTGRVADTGKTVNAIDAVNNYLKSHGVNKENELVKPEVETVTGVSINPLSTYGLTSIRKFSRIKNQGDVNNAINKIGESGDVFNELAKQIKKQPKSQSTGK